MRLIVLKKGERLAILRPVDGEKCEPCDWADECAIGGSDKMICFNCVQAIDEHMSRRAAAKCFKEKGIRCVMKKDNKDIIIVLKCDNGQLRNACYHTTSCGGCDCDECGANTTERISHKDAKAWWRERIKKYNEANKE